MNFLKVSLVGLAKTSALNVFSIFYTHHRIPNKHMMTINFDHK
jgi:hypothetical protein